MLSREEGVKKSENFADVIYGRSLYSEQRAEVQRPEQPQCEEAPVHQDVGDAAQRRPQRRRCGAGASQGC